jgi:hypothetical protein
MGSASTSRPFPGFDHLYVVYAGGSRQAFRTEFELPAGMEVWDVQHGRVVPTGPLVARWVMGGKKPRDVIVSTWGSTIKILSERVVQMLKDRGFTGWSTFPIDVYGPDGAYVARYHGLAVHGRCGPLDKTRTTRVLVEYPAGWFPESKGFYFDPASWDGSDFFMTEDMGFVFVTEEVMRAFKKMKALHVEFTPLHEKLWRELLPETP